MSGEKGKQKKKTFKQMEEEEAARKVWEMSSSKHQDNTSPHSPPALPLSLPLSLSLSLSRSLFAGRPLRGPRAPQIAALPQPLIAMPDTTILIQTALAAQLAV